MQRPSAGLAPRRGRPRKFGRPSRAVTLTLPEDIISALSAVDRDVSRAVVRLARPQVGRRPHPPAELATFGRRAVIVVNPSRTLERRTGVLLVPLSDGRALISFDETTTPARLELVIRDVLDEHELPAADAGVFESIADILRSARRSGGVTLQQRNIIVLESKPASKKKKKKTNKKKTPGGSRE